MQMSSTCYATPLRGRSITMLTSLGESDETFSLGFYLPPTHQGEEVQIIQINQFVGFNSKESQSQPMNLRWERCWRRRNSNFIAVICEEKHVVLFDLQDSWDDRCDRKESSVAVGGITYSYNASFRSIRLRFFCFYPRESSIVKLWQIWVRVSQEIATASTERRHWDEIFTIRAKFSIPTLIRNNMLDMVGGLLSCFWHIETRIMTHLEDVGYGIEKYI